MPPAAAGLRVVSASSHLLRAEDVLLHMDVAFRTLTPADGSRGSRSQGGAAEAPAQLDGGMLSVRLSAFVEPPKQSSGRRAAASRKAAPPVENEDWHLSGAELLARPLADMLLAFFTLNASALRLRDPQVGLLDAGCIELRAAGPSDGGTPEKRTTLHSISVTLRFECRTKATPARARQLRAALLSAAAPAAHWDAWQQALLLLGREMAQYGGTLFNDALATRARALRPSLASLSSSLGSICVASSLRKPNGKVAKLVKSVLAHAEPHSQGQAARERAARRLLRSASLHQRSRSQASTRGALAISATLHQGLALLDQRFVTASTIPNALLPVPTPLPCDASTAPASPAPTALHASTALENAAHLEDVQDDFSLLLDPPPEYGSRAVLSSPRTAPTEPAQPSRACSPAPEQHLIRRQLSSWASVAEAWVELEPDELETLDELRAAVHESHAMHALAVHWRGGDALEACCSGASLTAPFSLDELSDDTLVCMTLD